MKQKNIKQIDLAFILDLYDEYSKDLKSVRESQIKLYKKKGYWYSRHRWFRGSRKLLRLANIELKEPLSLRPQLDDIEAEITYLLIRKFKPKVMVEISPAAGWSTSWILNALKDNGAGHLYSFDISDDSTKNVPSELKDNRWTFFKGDIKKTIKKLPKEIDYLFIDSDHSGDFAKWYLKNIFSKIKTHIPTSVHDVFHSEDPDQSGGEGTEVINWLESRKIKYLTASRAKNPIANAKIIKKRQRIGVDQIIHNWHDNSMIFFNL